jgi:hypothetical protein
VAAFAVAAPAASAAEGSEVVSLELTPRKHVQVLVEIDPQLGVAVIRTALGFSPKGVPRPRSGMVEYAARIAKGSAEGKLDVEIPGIASIVGELVPISAGGVEFQGDLEFHGNGGYLEFDAHAVTASVTHDDEIVKFGSGLFAYLPGPLIFSDRNSQVLSSSSARPGDSPPSSPSGRSGTRGRPSAPRRSNGCQGTLPSGANWKSRRRRGRPSRSARRRSTRSRRR